MEKHKLQPLTAREKRLAEENHNLVYSFLHQNSYSIEEYYNIVIFGYLKAVQAWCRSVKKRKKYCLSTLTWLYMRAEVGNHFRTGNYQCRKPTEGIISFDAEYAETENLYNAVGGESVEDGVLEEELLNDIMENLSELQKKITQLKINGYSNKETYLIIGMRPSTYYKEMKRIRAIVENILIG